MRRIFRRWFRIKVKYNKNEITLKAVLILHHAIITVKLNLQLNSLLLKETETFLFKVRMYVRF